MKDIVYKDLSYTITGLCFQAQNELGRFCRERQYSDKLEELLKERDISYKRECEMKNIEPRSPRGNRVDFLVADKIIVECKTKPFITKEDYYQTKRYLEASHMRLGMLINFRSKYLKPKRVLNSRYSRVHSRISHRNKGGFTLVEFVVIISIFAIIAGVTLANTGSFRADVSLSNLSHDIALAIRQAQTYGISASEGNPVVVQGATASYGAAFYYDNGRYENSFDIFKDINRNHAFDSGDGDALDTFTIRNRVSIAEICSGSNIDNVSCSNDDLYITFTRPLSDAHIERGSGSRDNYACITVQSELDKERAIEIFNTGNITVSRGSCS